MRRGIAPAVGMTTAAVATARAAVPAALAEKTVAYAASPLAAAGVVPVSVAAITRGVLISMFLSKLKVTALAMVTAASLTAGAVVLAQQGTKPPQQQPDPSAPVTGHTSQQPPEKSADGPPRLKYFILLSRDGGEPRTVSVIDVTANGIPVAADTPDARIVIHPRRAGLKQSPDLTDIEFANALARELAAVAPELKQAPVQLDVPQKEELALALTEMLRQQKKPLAQLDARQKEELGQVLTQLLRQREELHQSLTDVLNGARPATPPTKPSSRPPDVTREVPPKEPIKTDTDRRLDQLEQKVDQILGAIQRLGNSAPGTSKNKNKN